MCARAAKRGSGISEQSKIVLIKKCEVKSSGYRQQENIKGVKSRMRSGNKETHWPTPFVFSADLHYIFFPPTYSFLPFSV